MMMNLYRIFPPSRFFFFFYLSTVQSYRGYMGWLYSLCLRFSAAFLFYWGEVFRV